mgnify:CR=1 FL=1
MSKKLVAYFSATGTTASLAKKLAEAADADIFEIRPAIPYTMDDLNWRDRQSRSSMEMSDRSSRPVMAETVTDVSGYDTVYICFPVWWYVAPTIINTFLESCDFSGKRIILFATSGGSGFGKTVEGLQSSAPGANFIAGKVNPSTADISALAAM